MAYDPGPTEPTAQAMFNYALEYYAAAKLIYSQGLGLAPHGPFYYLISHSFELFTKSYLMSKGLTYDDLKKLNHKAGRLIQKCTDLKMQISDEHLVIAEVIDNLNVHHMQRYPMLGLFKLGPIGFVEPQNLLKHIKEYGESIKIQMNEQKINRAANE